MQGFGEEDHNPKPVSPLTLTSHRSCGFSLLKVSVCLYSKTETIKVQTCHRKCFGGQNEEVKLGQVLK